MNIVRQPEFIRFLETGDFADPVVIESQREPGVALAIQIVPFGVDEKLLISRDISRLEAVAKMRRDFIANVSHELKTPLTVIAGFLETLQELDLDEKQRERFVQLMREQARSMQRLVEDLLTLSALESEQNPLVDEPFAIVGLMLQLSSDAKGLSQGQHMVALDIGDAATVVGSRDELASAFGNLVSNAIRYTPSGGTITLGWRVDDNGTRSSPSLTAASASRRSTSQLTERYRIDRSRSRATGGTGQDWPSSSTCCSGTRRRSKLPVTPARAVLSRCGCRHGACCAPVAVAAPAATGNDAERNNVLSSSRPTSTGALRITRYCGSAPFASASM
jgi:two-component system phosphate regulon sensor histidine kinase PhoR